jgi:hypothetical protein
VRGGNNRMEKISKFLVRLGFPLHNTRWSWGARSKLGVLLTTWTDGLDETGRFVCVFGRSSQGRSHANSKERLDHLRTLWSGGLAGYAVIATAQDTTAQPRKIRSYDSENVRAIVSLIAQPDGSIWAEIGEDVSVKKLKKHATSHRLMPGVGAFPTAREPSKVFKASSAAYLAKLPAMREWLITVARRRKTVTYAEARAPFGLRTLEHRHAMDRIGHECVDAGEPILTSLIVDETTGRCSEGFIKEFRRDDAEERDDCYAFWLLEDTAPVWLGGLRKHDGSAPKESLGDSLSNRAARFAKIAVRPDQAAFRRRVFMAHRGVCVVTGCAIPEALDAAHRDGRNWQLGHNSGADGLLLRKDIHALYDAKLVSIDGNIAEFHQDVAPYYRDFTQKQSLAE